MRTIGLFGCGNMGVAIVGGYLKQFPEAAEKIVVYDKERSKAEELRRAWPGIRIADSAAALAKTAELALIAVKPQHFQGLIDEAGEALAAARALVVSIAVGIPLAQIETALPVVGEPWRIIRVMPNTPALVGQGMSALCRNNAVGDADFEEALTLFRAVGSAAEIPEQLMHAVVGVSGSSPAYVYLFIEALADGAVAWGLNRADAYRFAAQTVLGAAAMVLETGRHPGELKDMVCSPGGTTIQAVKVLEETGLRASVLAAVDAAAGKSKEMSGD